VPFEPHDPEERLRLMLDDAGVRLLVTRRRHHADGAGRDALFVDADAEELATWLARGPNGAQRRVNVCYAIFTSGSTGKPKAVVLSHRAVVNTFRLGHANVRDRSDRSVTIRDVPVFRSFGIRHLRRARRGCHCRDRELREA